MIAVEMLTVRRAPFGGPGYIAGELPDGLVTINDAPAVREVEVRHRASRFVVATTFSASDGTYRIDGLSPNEEFDVIFRDWKREWNDVIWPAVKPHPYA